MAKILWVFAGWIMGGKERHKWRGMVLKGSLWMSDGGQTVQWVHYTVQTVNCTGGDTISCTAPFKVNLPVCFFIEPAQTAGARKARACALYNLYSVHSTLCALFTVNCICKGGLWITLFNVLFNVFFTIQPDFNITALHKEIECIFQDLYKALQCKDICWGYQKVETNI